MADFKNAEQYVVEKLESVESQLELLKKIHKVEIENNLEKIAELQAELTEAYSLIDIFRDYLYAIKDNYFGNIIKIEPIYGKEHPEEVARLMEYFDVRPEEDV